MNVGVVLPFKLFVSDAGISILGLILKWSKIGARPKDVTLELRVPSTVALHETLVFFLSFNGGFDVNAELMDENGNLGPRLAGRW